MYAHTSFWRWVWHCLIATSWKIRRRAQFTLAVCAESAVRILTNHAVWNNYYEAIGFFNAQKTILINLLPLITPWQGFPHIHSHHQQLQPMWLINIVISNEFASGWLTTKTTWFWLCLARTLTQHTQEKARGSSSTGCITSTTILLDWKDLQVLMSWLNCKIFTNYKQENVEHAVERGYHISLLMSSYIWY